MTCRVSCAIVAGLAAIACGRTAPGATHPDPGALRARLASLSPAKLPGPPPDPTNGFSEDPLAAALGQKIFFDPGFSGALIDGDNDGSADALGSRGQTGRVSCAGCHVATSGFVDTRSFGGQASLAAGWSPRRTPLLLDVAQSSILGWDGRRDSTWSQFFGPLENANEMNSSRLYLAQHLRTAYRADYERVFGSMPAFDDPSRFPQIAAANTGCTLPPGGGPICYGRHGQPGDGAEYDGLSAADKDAVTRAVANAGKAVGAYLRKLSCGPSRMDAFAHGDDAALSASEQRGAALFVGSGNCLQCHSGPFLSDEKFHDVGLHPVTVSAIVTDDNDLGAATGVPALLRDPLNSRGAFSDGDDGRLVQAAQQQVAGGFRTPKLRCVSKRPSLMHTAQLRSLEETVAFFNDGGHLGGYPGRNELTPLGLGETERADLVAFLRALDGPGPADALLHAP